MEVHQRVLAGESLELVGSGSKIVSSLLFEVISDLLGESDVCVQTGSDCGASLSNLVDVFKGLNYAHVAVAQLVHVSGELLAKS